jgi:hypothetical protein
MGRKNEMTEAKSAKTRACFAKAGTHKQTLISLAMKVFPSFMLVVQKKTLPLRAI